jgi:hypothetical protein
MTLDLEVIPIYHHHLTEYNMTDDLSELTLLHFESGGESENLPEMETLIITRHHANTNAMDRE